MGEKDQNDIVALVASGWTPEPIVERPMKSAIPAKVADRTKPIVQNQRVRLVTAGRTLHASSLGVKLLVPVTGLEPAPRCLA